MVQAPPIAIAPKSERKSFQYAGHYQPNHDYSPFHKQLDASLRQVYSKSNLAAVVLAKDWLTEAELHRLDNSIMDIWAQVVWIKIPAQIPYRTTICKFISKKDFLQVVFDKAQAKSQGMRACKHEDRSKILMESVSGKYYDLVPRSQQCNCSCPAYEYLSAAFAEDERLEGLLKAHPILKGQIPDKHVLGLWVSWQVKDFKEYQAKQKERESKRKESDRAQDKLRSLNLSLTQTIPGHFDVFQNAKRIGTVDQRFDLQGNKWWINQVQVGKDRVTAADHICYRTAEEAALALLKFCVRLDATEDAKADLFGGGWDTPTEHLVETHLDFIDEVGQQEQETRSQATQPRSRKSKAISDPFGGFLF